MIRNYVFTNLIVTAVTYVVGRKY